jgi:hypothetical protein
MQLMYVAGVSFCQLKRAIIVNFCVLIENENLSFSKWIFFMMSN